jgi:hypothetical protein
MQPSPSTGPHVELILGARNCGSGPARARGSPGIRVLVSTAARTYVDAARPRPHPDEPIRDWEFTHLEDVRGSIQPAIGRKLRGGRHIGMFTDQAGLGDIVYVVGLLRNIPQRTYWGFRRSEPDRSAVCGKIRFPILAGNTQAKLTAT